MEKRIGEEGFRLC